MRERKVGPKSVGTPAPSGRPASPPECLSRLRNGRECGGRSRPKVSYRGLLLAPQSYHAAGRFLEPLRKRSADRAAAAFQQNDVAPDHALFPDPLPPPDLPKASASMDRDTLPL